MPYSPYTQVTLRLLSIESFDRRLPKIFLVFLFWVSHSQEASLVPSLENPEVSRTFLGSFFQSSQGVNNLPWILPWFFLDVNILPWFLSVFLSRYFPHSHMDPVGLFHGIFSPLWTKFGLFHCLFLTLWTLSWSISRYISEGQNIGQWFRPRSVPG